MLRILLILAPAAAWVAACAEPPPQPPADGELIRGAVQLAQARADKASPPESGK